MASERQEYNEVSPWWGEHVHRYQEAIKLISHNYSVLDIACGNGYGTCLISKATKNKVIGGDISREIIDECKQRFKNDNLHYQQMDGTKLPYDNEQFDSIVTFETIEHTTQYIKMLTEFHRVVASNGILFISTPNIILNSPKGIVTNPFHTQEFTYDELEMILKSAFDEVHIFGQKYIRYKAWSLRNIIGRSIESILYLRGFRKIPIAFQNKIMRLVIKTDMYPLPADYELTSEKNEVIKCKTFFAVCKKK